MSGMSLDQCIAMLMAARAQGATEVSIAAKGEMQLAECSGVDWISPHPVNGVVYIAPMPVKEVMCHESQESIDW